MPAASSRFWLAGLPPILAALIFYKFNSHLTFSLSTLSRSLSAPNLPIFPTQVVSLTRTLVDIPSSTGLEQSVFQYAESWLRHQNVTVISQPILPLTSSLPPRSNLLAIHPLADSSSVRVLLSTHLDTVPPSPQNNTATDIDRKTKLRGRGSVDAKGQAAAMMLAFCGMQNARVALLLVCGEESDHAGMLNAHKLGFGSVSVINGEPTESKIAITQKGMIRAHIHVSGKAAHSGYPHLGDSAIHKLIDLLQDLRTHTCKQGVTLNVGTINGGSAPNVVADSADAVVMWRVIADAETVVRVAKNITEQYRGAELRIIRSNDGMNFFLPPIAEQLGTTTVAYNTDLPYYRGPTVRLVLFGAGSIHQAHSSDEYVDISQLTRLPGLYQEIAKDLLDDMDKVVLIWWAKVGKGGGIGGRQNGIIDSQRTEEGTGNEPDNKEKKSSHCWCRSDSILVEKLNIALEESEPNEVVDDEEDD